MRGDILDCYRILEVAPESGPAEVKRSYRELVKVWHPDRFAHDPRFAKRAQEKLKLINLAYARICTESKESARNARWEPPHQAPKEPPREAPRAAQGCSLQSGPTAKRKGGLVFIQIGLTIGAVAGAVLTFDIVGWWCAQAVGYTALPTQATPRDQIPKEVVRPPPKSDEPVYSEAELLDIWQERLRPSNPKVNTSAPTRPPENDATNRTAASPFDKVLQPGNENTAPQFSAAEKVLVSRNDFTVAATKDQVITFPRANMSPSTTPARIDEEKQKKDFDAIEPRTELQATPQIEPPEAVGAKAETWPDAGSYFVKDLVKLAEARISEGNILLYARRNRLVSPIAGEEEVFLRQHGVPKSVILAVSAPKFPNMTSPRRSVMVTGPANPTSHQGFSSEVTPSPGTVMRMGFHASSRTVRQRPAAPPHNNNPKR